MGWAGVPRIVCSEQISYTFILFVGSVRVLFVGRCIYINFLAIPLVVDNHKNPRERIKYQMKVKVMCWKFECR